MRRTSMLRPIINVLLVSALLTVGLTATVALAAPGIQGCSGHNNTVEECQTGPPDQDTAPARGFGAATSQRASTEHDIGPHSSNPLLTEEDAEALANGDPQLVDRDTPRKGVGNVARTDSNLVGAIDELNGANVGPPVDLGASPGAHGCLISQLDDLIGADDEHVTDCTAAPGNPDKP